MPGGCGDEVGDAGDGTHVAQGQWRAHVVFVEGIRLGAVRACGPEGMDFHEVSFLVLPVRVADASVVEAVGVAVDILVVGEVVDFARLGFPHVEIRVEMIVGDVAALGCPRTSVGGEYDVPVGEVGRLEVVVGGVVGQLLDLVRFQIQFEEMQGLVELA